MSKTPIMLREPLDGTERGFLLETWTLHELRAAMAFQNTGGQLYYWRTLHGAEVDFVWTRARHAVGIEVKSSDRWRYGFGGSCGCWLRGVASRSEWQ